MSDHGDLVRTLEQGTAPAMPEAPPTLGVVLKRRRMTVGSFLLAAVSLAALYVGIQPVQYTSSSTILVEGSTQAGSALDQLGRVGAVSQVQTEMGMIRSRRVLEPVVDGLDLHVKARVDGELVDPQGLFAYFEAGPEISAGAYVLRTSGEGTIGVFTREGEFPITMGAPGDTLEVGGMLLAPPDGVFWQEIEVDAEPFSAAVASVLDRVSTRTRDPTADLIEISCSGEDPLRAQSLCDAVAGSYVRLRTALQRTEASSTARFLGEQVAVVQGHLAAMEDSLESFALKHRIVALEEQASEEVRQLAALDAERLALNREYDALAGLVRRIEGDAQRAPDRIASSAGGGGGSPVSARYRDLASFPRFLQHGAVTELVSTLVDLENQRGELLQRRQPSAPEVRAIEVRLADVETQLGAFATTYLESLSSQRRALDDPLSASASRLDALPAQQVTYARMERQTALLSDLYGFLETRRREAEVAQQVELPSVRILDAASMPHEPTSPSWAFSLLAACCFGLGGGVVTAFYREYADPTLHGRRAVELGTGLPVISMIPTLPKGGAVFDGQIIRRRVPRNTGSARKEEVVREAFRGLLTDLEFRRRQLGGARLRSIAVVSAGPGEGKTFTASNIALAHASVGSKTLLVDADMRAGGVSEFFGFPSLAGLSEVLAGDMPPEEVIRLLKIEKANQRSSGALAVLPAGTPTSLSAALLHGHAFDAVVNRVEPDFDLIVVDTAPLNVLSDAMPVAAAVDGVLLVVRGGRTDRQALEHAMDRLDRVGATMIGIVLNDSEAPKSYGVYSSAYTLNA